MLVGVPVVSNIWYGLVVPLKIENACSHSGLLVRRSLSEAIQELPQMGAYFSVTKVIYQLLNWSPFVPVLTREGPAAVANRVNSTRAADKY